MAKPTGALDPKDFPYVVNGEEDTVLDYIYFIHNLHTMPPHWNDDGYIKNQKLYVDWMCNANAASKVKCWWRTHNGPITYLETDSGTWQWGNGAAPVTMGGYPVGTEVSDLGWSNYILPRYLVHEMELWHDKGGADGDLFGIYIETVNDKAYIGAWSPANARYCERITRDTPGERAYAEERPASSWMVTELDNTMNNLLYEARMSWSLPLFGGGA